MPTFGSLFSGIGGFDLGLEQAGWECRWQVERDKQCNQVLAHHWPNVERWEDVEKVHRVRPIQPNSRGRRDPHLETVNRDRASALGLCGGGPTLAPVELICGGFPCQDLSVAGRRAGLAGERSGLWFEFQRILAALRPRWVVVENVPGLLSSHGGRDMGLLLGGLAELGYGWAYRVLDAQYFGVAQRRRRVFIVGCLGDGRRAAEVLFDGASLQRHPPTRSEAGADVTGCLAGGPSSSSAGNVDDNRAQAGFVEDGTGRGAIAFNCQQDPISSESTWGAPAGGADQAVLSTRPRRLTPRECERLQGFPDDWTAIDGMKDGPRYRMLGNAVAVPVARWIGERLQDAL